ncbi:hypothetical protein DPMN_192619 [Dreissena polymorpha]|uniref:Mab-21-like HhH/H2TH-like domain-containing protein n=2 Tax=Dreissena polymorpha TaxID=45954 RepID=A0A9D3Y517_DREPO|nr:hypothetical protein DPMN_192619 [Dreissena polymorpha]
MTQLGYGEEIRRMRVEKYRAQDTQVNSIANIFSCQTTVGSKAEGLTFSFESDRDHIIVREGVTCLEAGVDLRTIPDDIEVYRMDTSVYPGHCRMLLERPASKRFIEIINSLCDDGKGNTILSSGLFLDGCAKYTHGFWGAIPGERAGPSLPVSTKIGGFKSDIVFAFPCQCPGILHRWAHRPRLWPQPDVVQKIVLLGSFVTPIGFKGSEYGYLEWRICFNTGETELVNNLTDTQAKVYVILKMILKEILKPKTKAVTSYVLKNVILWQAESNSPALFQERNLIYWLHDALGTLRTAISSKQLPYYMIPERNLMAACGLQEVQQHKLVADILDMMDEGPRVILRLPKIRQAIIGHPEPLLWLIRRKLELEMIYLEFMNRMLQIRNENWEFDCSDTILQEILRRQSEIHREVSLRMFMEGNIVYNPYDINFVNIFYKIQM